MTHPHVEFAMKIGGAYSEEELESLRQEVEKLPEYAKIVEIGVYRGRSASILLQALQDKPLQVILIDDWSEIGAEAYGGAVSFYKQFESVKGWKLYTLPSDDAAKYVWGIDLLHVDGGHDLKSVTSDCQLYLPKVSPGGLVIFHDYERSTLPHVKPTVDKFTKDWVDLGIVGSQAKRRRPWQESTCAE